MTDAIVKDSNDNALANRGSVGMVNDLKVKGTSVTVKRGTLMRTSA